MTAKGKGQQDLLVTEICQRRKQLLVTTICKRRQDLLVTTICKRRQEPPHRYSVAGSWSRCAEQLQARWLCWSATRISFRWRRASPLIHHQGQGGHNIGARTETFGGIITVASLGSGGAKKVRRRCSLMTRAPKNRPRLIRTTLHSRVCLRQTFWDKIGYTARLQI